MSNAAFLLMNCDLVAVSLQLGCAGVVTIYCGAQRARQLVDAGPGLASDALRFGWADADGGTTTARSDGGSKSYVGTRPPVAREIASHRSAGAWPFFSHL